MPGIFEYAGNLYDIDDLKIAVNNNNGTFGTLIDVPAVDMFRMEFQTKNQRANGGSAEYRAAASDRARRRYRRGH